MIGTRKPSPLHRTAFGAAAVAFLLILLGSATAATAAVQLSPQTRDFGSRLIADGPSPPFQFTLEVTGDTEATIESVEVTGGQRGQFVLGDVTACTGAPLPPGGSCSIPVSFDPGSVGVKNATLVVTPALPDEPVTASLTGSGTQPPVSLSPPEHDFGNRAIGTGRTPFRAFRFTWRGVGDATIASVGITGADRGQFVIASNSTCVSGGVLASGSFCNVRVAFRPRSTEPGLKQANVTVRTTADLSASSKIRGTADPAPLPPPPPECEAVGTVLRSAFRSGSRKSNRSVIRLRIRSERRAIVRVGTRIKFRAKGRSRSVKLRGLTVDSGGRFRVISVPVPGRLRNLLPVGRRVRAIVVTRSRARDRSCVSNFGPRHTTRLKVRVQRAN